MTHVSQVEFAILQDLEQRGPCTIDELTRRLPDYSWNQIFTGVDRLSRRGALLLRHPTKSEYVISLKSQEAATLRATSRRG